MIIDGKKIAERILKELRDKIEKEKLKLKLAVILVGDDFASKVYVKKKQEACKRIGIVFKLFNFPSEISEEELKKNIKRIASKPDVTAILVQLPLPGNFNVASILESVPKEKDAENQSPVVCAVERIIKDHEIELEDKKIALIGRGKLVGGPLAEWLEERGLEFCDIEGIKKADIVIIGVGKPKMISGDMIKEGAIVIDIGFSHDKNGRAVGDIDFETVFSKAKLITPVPGGVGPITIACLLKNLVK